MVSNRGKDLMRGIQARQLRRLAGKDKEKYKRLKKAQNNKFRPSTYKPDEDAATKQWNREAERRYRFSGQKSQSGKTHNIKHNVPTSSNHNPAHDANESNHDRVVRSRTISGRRHVNTKDGVVINPRVKNFKSDHVRRFRNGKEIKIDG